MYNRPPRAVSLGIALIDTARNAYLKALGIDVWVRRERRVPPAVSVEPDTPVADVARPGEVPVLAEPGAVAPAPAARRRPTRPADGEPRIEFVVRCVRLGRAFAMVDQTWSGLRFVLDVVRALNGYEAAERKEIRFQWPQIESGDLGPTAARRALRAFASGQIDGADTVLVVGTRMADLLGLDVPDGVAETTVAGARAVIVPRPLREVEEKRALWQLIRKAP